MICSPGCDWRGRNVQFSPKSELRSMSILFSRLRLSVLQAGAASWGLFLKGGLAGGKNATCWLLFGVGVWIFGLFIDRHSLVELTARPFVVRQYGKGERHFSVWQKSSFRLTGVEDIFGWAKINQWVLSGDRTETFKSVNSRRGKIKSTKLEAWIPLETVDKDFETRNLHTTEENRKRQVDSKSPGPFRSVASCQVSPAKGQSTPSQFRPTQKRFERAATRSFGRRRPPKQRGRTLDFFVDAWWLHGFAQLMGLHTSDLFFLASFQTRAKHAMNTQTNV